jgi:predicted RNase H-like HicB family nuclease
MPAYGIIAILFSKEAQTVKQFKIVVERHSDGYVAYPLGISGVVVGEGDTYEEALADVKSALAFHIETFGPGVIENETPVLEAFVAELGVAA